MKLILSHKTITWEIKNSQNIIDLIFMSNELINRIKHCKIKSEINQSFDHISIFTKFLLKIVTTSIIFRKLWKSINVEKIKEIKKKVLLIKNSKIRSQINKSIKKLQNYLIEIINKIIYKQKQAAKANSFDFETASKRFSSIENYDENEQKIIWKKIDKNMSKAMTEKKTIKKIKQMKFRKNIVKIISENEI